MVCGFSAVAYQIILDDEAVATDKSSRFTMGGMSLSVSTNVVTTCKSLCYYEGYILNQSR